MAGDEVKFDVRNIIGTFSSDQSIVVVLLVQGGTKTNMASLKERLNDNEYKLWIKASLCLHYTKKGIGIFTDDRCKKTHAFVKTAVEKHAIVKNPDGDIKAMSEICNNAKVVKRGNRWSLGCCNDCEIYVKEIAHLSQPPFRIELSNWCNSEVQLWPSEPWEIAKVYMNKGQRPFAFQRNSQETDLSGLLNFIDHCRVPRVDIQNMDNITKVIQTLLVTGIQTFIYLFSILVLRVGFGF